MTHRARGRPPNNKIAAGIQGSALALLRKRYLDFGPTLSTEMLARHHGLTVSRETLRQRMPAGKRWAS